MKKARTRWLIAIVIASLFYIPVIRPVANDLGAKAVILQVVFSTMWLIAAILILLIFRATIWFVRKFSSNPGPTLDLPADAFQVRINLVRLHVRGLIFTSIAAGLSAAAYRALWTSLDGLYPTIFILDLIPLIILHELSHALGLIIRGIPIRSIKFGVMWHILAPYAHCKVPMSMSVYRFGLMLPLFTSGIVPVGVGLFNQDVNLTAAGAILVGGACGDLSMFAASIAFHPQSQVMDHPSEPAFIILDKGNLPGPLGTITVG